MSKVKFELDKAGVKKCILQSSEMLAHVTQQANNRCGSGQHVKPFVGFDRAKAIIYPNTKEHSG